MNDIQKELVAALKALNFDFSDICPDKELKPIKSIVSQQIFYGAPGTGKSYTIDRETKGYAVVRTTFHPDSDYSTFVGAYKPVMDEVDVKVTPIVTNNGVSLQPSGIYKEKRIAYKFVKQAFLKAYLGAWKKYVDNGPKQNGVVVTASNGEKFILKEVAPDYVAYTKETQINITQFENNVKDYWNNNVSQDNKDNWKWFQQIVCLWYQERDDEEQSADKCWDAFTKELKGEKKSLSYSTSNQQYLITSDGSNIIIKTCKERKAGQDKIEEEFNKNGVTYISVQATIAKKLHDYGGTFEEAWGKLEKEVKEHLLSHSDAADSNGILPQFLIIEEINRGNCAQIFGDLFQLLDRGENKFSEYPIEADTDLQQEIAWAFKEEKEYKLSSNINIEGAVKGYTSNYGKTLSEDVQEGRVLLLPPNLYIWATMNTSDQSLFPIDSAFKRRWDWEYMPIGYKNSNWTIEIGDKKYKWVDFQQKINDKIYDVDNSEDKQLGDYFVNADRTDNKISAKTLLNKILFYLWNDVCKDDPDQIFRRKDDKDNNQEKSIKFSEFFCDDDERDRKLQGFMAFNKVPEIGESQDANSPETPQVSDKLEINDSPAVDDNEVNS